MSCEFTPHQPPPPAPSQAEQPGSGAKPYWLSAAEVEQQEHDELDADGRQMLAWVLALLGGVALVSFALGFIAASTGAL